MCSNSLAYAEMRLILALFLYNFDVRLADGTDGWAENQEFYQLWRRPSMFVHLTPVQH